MAKIHREMSKLGTEVHELETELEISNKIADDFKSQYEMALDEINDLQSGIDDLLKEFYNQQNTTQSLKSK